MGHRQITGINTLQLIKSIHKFDGVNFIERTRTSNGVLQLYWRFLSEIMFGLERSIHRGGSREGMENACVFKTTVLVLMKEALMIRAIYMKNLTMVTTLRPRIQQMATCSAS